MVASLKNSASYRMAAIVTVEISQRVSRKQMNVCVNAMQPLGTSQTPAP